MKSVTIGRDPGCDVVLPDAYVSGRHLHIRQVAEDRWELQDLGSRNGTFVNGHRVLESMLAFNDIVKIGETVLPWHTYFQEAAQPEGKILRTLALGRAPSNDVALEDSHVSARHALLHQLPGGRARVEDLNSTNGTFINEMRRQNGVLQPGDKLRFGTLEVDWEKLLAANDPARPAQTPRPAAAFQKPKPVNGKNIKRRRRWLWAAILLLILGGCVAVAWPYISEASVPDPGPNSGGLPVPNAMQLYLDCGSEGTRYPEFLSKTDYMHPQVRNLAATLAAANPGEFNLGQVCDIYDFCYAKWRYVEDPQTQEFISAASNTIATGYVGDCDDFAVLMNALLIAVGGEARLNLAWSGESGHAFCEVNAGPDTEENRAQIRQFLFERYGARMQGERIHYRKDDQNRIWLNLDWTAEYPGGAYFNFIEGVCFNFVRGNCAPF